MNLAGFNEMPPVSKKTKKAISINVVGSYNKISKQDQLRFKAPPYFEKAIPAISRWAQGVLFKINLCKN